MARFSEAAAVVVVYLIFVLSLSSILKKLWGSGDAGEAEVKKTVLQKFTDEPILVIAAAYNAAQVRTVMLLMYLKRWVIWFPL